MIMFALSHLVKPFEYIYFQDSRTTFSWRVNEVLLGLVPEQTTCMIQSLLSNSQPS